MDQQAHVTVVSHQEQCQPAMPVISRKKSAEKREAVDLTKQYYRSKRVVPENDKAKEKKKSKQQPVQLPKVTGPLRRSRRIQEKPVKVSRQKSKGTKVS